MHAAHARPAALAAHFAARSTFPGSVTEYPLSSSPSFAFPRVACVTALRSGDRGPSAP